MTPCASGSSSGTIAARAIGGDQALAAAASASARVVASHVMSSSSRPKCP
jgi:hypothetical protein